MSRCARTPSINARRALRLGAGLLSVAGAAFRPPLAAQQVYNTPILEGARAEAANDWLVRRMAAGFAGAVIVAEKGKPVLRGGYGMANPERSIPWSTSLAAPIASLTKLFTATAVVDLFDRRLLSPTDRLEKFFPEYVTPATGALTLHQLLTHTAGFAPFSGEDFDVMPLDRFLETVLGVPPAQAPGTMRPSNIGFSLLAAVLEQVSGLTLDDLLRTRLFKPVGMTRTGYHLSLPPDSMVAGILRRGTRGIHSDSLAPRTTLRGDYWNLYGGGGMHASADDMYAFFDALRRGTVLSKGARDALWAPQVKRPDGAEYGYGWLIRRDAKGRLEQVSHSGSDGTFLASLNWFPQEELFVYVSSNVAGRETMLSETIAGVMKAMRGLDPRAP